MIRSSSHTAAQPDMYISRSVLILLVFIFLIMLVGVDWMTASDSNWYNPFLIALIIIGFSAWSQWRQEEDDY